MPYNKKMPEIIVSKTKIYLIIITILFIVLCYLNVKLILPAIIIYSIILAYSLWTTNKNKLEISKHIQDLTISVDSAAKSTLINSPIQLIIIETNGNILWRSSKFNNEFINVDIGSYLKELSKELKNEIESITDKQKKSIEKIKIYAFFKLPILMKINFFSDIYYLLFWVIPILKCKIYKNQIKYYLFSFIPVLRIKNFNIDYYQKNIQITKNNLHY